MNTDKIKSEIVPEDGRLSALRGKTVIYAICGSYCTLHRSIAALCRLDKNGCILLPAMSENALKFDTRFGRAADFKMQAEKICGRPVISSIPEAEPLGPKIKADAMVISPCTSNSLAKIVNAVADTSVTMAAKAFLRCSSGPLLIALSTNDGLGGSLKNIAAALERKRVFMVPMRQDDVIRKPNSLSADFEHLEYALCDALDGVQTRPVFTV